jgi:hypothetical protein
MKAILSFATLLLAGGCAAACGPPLSSGADAAADAGADADSDAGPSLPSTCKAPRPAPACASPTTCLLNRPMSGDPGDRYCSSGSFPEPTISGNCLVPYTTGTMIASIGGQAFAATRVAARRLGGCVMEIVGTSPSNEEIRVVVPDAVGTFACTQETGAWVMFSNFNGTTSTAFPGRGTGPIEVTAIGSEVAGTFAVDDRNVDLLDGRFSVTLAQ